MYDIYLYSGCESPFNKEKIDEKFSFLRNDQFTQKVLTVIPGFLGLDLEKEIVIEVLKMLGKYEANGIYVPSKYRHPTITKDIALEIGNREKTKLLDEFPGFTFYQPYVSPRGVLWWVVSIGCKEWEDAGDLPGAVILWVDKCDGHIWEDSEVESFTRDQPLKRI
jgi:hypothetical protein